MRFFKELTKIALALAVLFGQLLLLIPTVAIVIGILTK